jgi:hypothetical protein
MRKETVWKLLRYHRALSLVLSVRSDLKKKSALLTLLWLSCFTITFLQFFFKLDFYNSVCSQLQDHVIAQHWADNNQMWPHWQDKWIWIDDNRLEHLQGVKVGIFISNSIKLHVKNFSELVNWSECRAAENLCWSFKTMKTHSVNFSKCRIVSSLQNIVAEWYFR